MEKKTALVISGGGCKGAFAVGVVKHIFENIPEINFDMIFGTSTGALMSPLIAIKEMELLERIYTTTNTPDVVDTSKEGKRFIGGNDSIFDGKPLVRLAQQTYDDQMYDRILNSGVDIFINTVCLQTQGVVVFSTKDMPLQGSDYEVIKMANKDEFIRAIVASASQPFFMSPINVRPNELRQYVDGGIREYLSIQIAIDNGATDIYAIALTPSLPTVTKDKYSSLIDILKLSIDIFSTDVGDSDIRIPKIYNEGLTYIESVKDKMQASGLSNAQIDEFFNTKGDNPFRNKKKLNIHIIRPENPLGGGLGGLEFVPEEMIRMKIEGEAMAKKYFEKVKLGNIVV
jgi:NTE family protein